MIQAVMCKCGCGASISISAEPHCHQDRDWQKDVRAYSKKRHEIRTMTKEEAKSSFGSCKKTPTIVSLFDAIK